MTEQVKKATAEVQQIFTAIEDSLQENWSRKDSLQLQDLLEFVIQRCPNISLKAHEIDFYMRGFLRTHSEYHVARGPRGGVMCMSTHLERENKKKKVAEAKQELLNAIESAEVKASE